MEQILAVSNLVKKFGGLVAVSNIDMTVNKGEIVGLIGANGAGKTTIFNMISGSFHPTSGKILLEGKEVQNLPAHKMCNLGIGRTYQIVQPFADLSVLENTMVGALVRDADVNRARTKSKEILQFLGMEKRMHVLGRDLNLPELKRMEVARALATQPKILLLDEVMAGLNPSDSAMVIELVRKINESGVTIILIEHVMKAVMSLSDRLYVLNQGKLISSGLPEEVSKDPEVIKSYLGEKSRKNPPQKQEE